jgi:hypothetical protein
MYVGAGVTIYAILDELIANTSLDVTTTAVDQSNNIAVSLSLLDNPVTIVSANTGFVDEIIIKNNDTIPHGVAIVIDDGVDQRFLYYTILSMGASAIYKPKTGWQNQGSALTSGWVNSGHIGDSTVTSGNIASGQIYTSHLSSGDITSGHLSDNSVVSGSIGSGQINDFNFTSGARIDSAEYLLSEGLISAETISGGRGVTLNQSGALIVARAGQSGRYPAIGVCVNNVLSGQPVSRYHLARVVSPTHFNFVGGMGCEHPIWLGLSGEMAFPTPPLPGGSGINQIIAFGTNPQRMTIFPQSVISGNETRYSFGLDSAQENHIASGQIGLNHIGSGAVNEEAFDAASISTLKFTSGFFAVGRGCVEGLIDTVVAEEAISGCKPINISQSGRARIAMSSVSGRMPVVAILFNNVVSGEIISFLSGHEIIDYGEFYGPSGLLPTSGFGRHLFVGASGDIVTRDGITSGCLVQRIGANVDSGLMSVAIDNSVTSGFEVGAP